ncbi:MAG: serine hydrolase [bacterium]
MRILKTIVNILTITLIVGLTGCFNSQSVEAKLDSYIKAYVELGKFSGSVLVAKDGKILLCKGYGMANYEHDIPNTPQTKFRLASITKQFTAMAVMQLQEQGLLSVNDTLSKYIPDYPSGNKITIHHLLTHTSGVPNVTAFPESERKKIKPHTLEQLIERFKLKPLDFKPGEKHSYSNSGYILLSYIIEKASGKKYETVLKENIFTPLNMINSGYDKSSTVIKNRASGYSMSGDELINASYIDMSYPAGAGALYSTVEDLYLWDQALYSEKLLSDELRATVFAPHSIMHQDDPDSSSYGYGWCIGKLHNRNITEHAGGIDGFSTDICRYPDEKVCVIVLSNCNHFKASKIAQGLAAIVFREKYELPKKHIAISINPTIYDQYVGKYKIDENLVIGIIKEGNQIFAQPSNPSKPVPSANQSKLELLPESDIEFFHKTVDAQISFIKDETGKVTKLILHDGKDRVGTKIE